MKSKKKEKPIPIDGWGNPKEIENVRKAIRQVWNWSYSRRLAKNRCLDKDGFFVCEKCKKKTPKIQIHHINTVGDLDSGFLERLFCPSDQLLCLCPKCHGIITKEERKLNESKS